MSKTVLTVVRSTPWARDALAHGHGSVRTAGFSVSVRLLLVCLAVVLCFGCGKYKEELEQTKQQMDKLNSEIARLTAQSGAFDNERVRLSDDVKTLSEKTSELRREVIDLRKAKEASDQEEASLKKKNNELQDEVSALKKQKTDLEQELQEIKKPRPEAMTPGPLPESAAGESPREPLTREGLSKPREKLAPCDAVVEFMKRSGAVVRQYKGTERKRMLEEVKQQFAPLMREAPQKALKAAESWVSELSAAWDKPGDDTVFSLLTKRNAAIDACGKRLEDSGL